MPLRAARNLRAACAPTPAQSLAVGRFRWAQSFAVGRFRSGRSPLAPRKVRISTE
jgi:hypothetical protein